jgi:hypothetical protein
MIFTVKSSFGLTAWPVSFSNPMLARSLRPEPGKLLIRCGARADICENATRERASGVRPIYGATP